MEEEVKNEDVFTQAESVNSTEVVEKQQTLSMVDDSEDSIIDNIDSKEEDEPDFVDDGLVEEDFTPILQSKSQSEINKEKGVKKNMNGKVITIKSIEVMKPKTKKFVDGNIVKINPSLTIVKKAEFYPTKLKIRFEEEDLVEYVPGVRVWVNDGKLNPNIKLDRNSNTKVAQLLRLALYTMKPGKFKLEEKEINEKKCLVVTEETKPIFDALNMLVSDADILKWMVGRKVRIKTSEGIYNGNSWFRNDISAFSKD